MIFANGELSCTCFFSVFSFVPHHPSFFFVVRITVGVTSILCFDGLHLSKTALCLKTKSSNSSKRVSRSGGGGGLVEESPCIEIGYREPTRAESREWSSTLAESSRVIFGVVIFDSDWLTKYKGFSCSILISCRQLFGFEHEPSVFGNVIK